MKTNKLLISFLALCAAFIQVTGHSQSSDDEIFVMAETMPVLKDSCEMLTSAMERNECTQLSVISFIQSRVLYPAIAFEEKLEGRVYVEFVIDTLGKVGNVRILKGLHPSMDKEVINSVKRLPTFIPAKNEGKPVNLRYTLPVHFKYEYYYRFKPSEPTRVKKDKDSSDVGVEDNEEEERLPTIEELEEMSVSTFPAPPDSLDETVYKRAERMPIFPGECEGIDDVSSQATCTESEIIGFVASHASYPLKARKKGIEGRIFIEFVVDENGDVTEIKVIKGVHKLIDNEAINAVKQLPKFVPAMQDGLPVKVKYTIPVNFKL